MSTTRTWTDAELMALPEDGFKRELVDGEIRVSPAGAPHGRVINLLVYEVVGHVRPRRLGEVLDSSTGVRMPSGNLRSPDMTFVSAARLPHGLAEGFLDVVPDLVAEVLSPGDSEREILDKVGEYLSAGVRLIWVIDRLKRHAVVFRSLTEVDRVEADGFLEGGDVLPGFRLRLGNLFD